MEEHILEETLEEKTERIFIETKQAIKETLESNVRALVETVKYKEAEYNFKPENMTEITRIVQGINAGLVDYVITKDVNGNEITLTADEYIERNKIGFDNKNTKKIELETLLEKLTNIETLAGFVNFANFEMAREYFLKEKENRTVIENFE